MERPLVVGVDGSDPSLSALDWAAAEAALHGVPLTVLYASRWQRYEQRAPSFSVDRPASRIYAEDIVGAAAERALRRIESVKVSTEIIAEDPATALVRRSREAGAIVVGSRGLGTLTGLLLGSVGLAVAAHAESPVFVVRGTDLDAPGDTVIVGVGEPAGATNTLAFALREAELRKVPLMAVHAWRSSAPELPGGSGAGAESFGIRPAETDFDEVLRQSGLNLGSLTVERRVKEGSARDALLDASTDGALLVVGARRRDSHGGMQLGSVNHAVLHHAACPVALVPHH
ncbi:universal stress protein [Streptomyces sp. NPDC019396]|uniref:universal stress protein n=1 Tax=Streptomyces sp. NPDC019396 TaxID=3154687 RepID=UPI0033DE1142